MADPHSAGRGENQGHRSALQFWFVLTAVENCLGCLGYRLHCLKQHRWRNIVGREVELTGRLDAEVVGHDVSGSLCFQLALPFVDWLAVPRVDPVPVCIPVQKTM